MHARGWALSSIIFAVGCGHDLHGSPDATSVDVAEAHPDSPAGLTCPAAPNSQVMLNHQQPYPFAALGNVDAGGEEHCGGPPEAVNVVLAIDPARTNLQDQVGFQLTLPVTTGGRPVMVSNWNGQTTWPAQLEITHVIVDGAGPGLAQIQGMLQGDQIVGAFTAIECAALTSSCI